VRLAEHKTHALVTKAAVANKERLLRTLPQLADQLQAYAKCTQKNAFLLLTLEKELTRAPVPDKLKEHIELLGTKVPFWISMVHYEASYVVKVNKSQEYRVVQRLLKSLVVQTS
jgi:hypothetical protein